MASLLHDVITGTVHARKGCYHFYLFIIVFFYSLNYAYFVTVVNNYIILYQSLKLLCDLYPRKPKAKTKQKMPINLVENRHVLNSMIPNEVTENPAAMFVRGRCFLLALQKYIQASFEIRVGYYKKSSRNSKTTTGTSRKHAYITLTPLNPIFI